MLHDENKSHEKVKEFLIHLGIFVIVAYLLIHAVVGIIAEILDYGLLFREGWTALSAILFFLYKNWMKFVELVGSTLAIVGIVRPRLSAGYREIPAKKIKRWAATITAVLVVVALSHEPSGDHALPPKSPPPSAALPSTPPAINSSLPVAETAPLKRSPSQAAPQITQPPVAALPSNPPAVNSPPPVAETAPLKRSPSRAAPQITQPPNSRQQRPQIAQIPPPASPAPSGEPFMYTDAVGCKVLAGIRSC